MKLPSRGREPDALFATMRERKKEDADWRGARTWSLVYPAGKDVEEVVEQANLLYLHENALNPMRFPSLRTMEREVVSMTAGLLNAPEGAGGCMTSGGTESILMAVKTARERARAERGVSEPQLLAPVSAHPAFAKGAKYFGLELVQIPLGRDLRADVKAAESLITERTAFMMGSAPNYPHGMVDDIPALAALAAERGIHFHVDACVGGFQLPFWERLGEPIPPFDFRVDGVSTISADVHKYGFCSKGASVLTHRDKDLMQLHQAFVYTDWPGGIYGSLAMAGARPAAPIAAAWAVMNYLGEEGYVRLAGRIRNATRRIQEGIAATPPLRVVGEPVIGVFAFGADGDVDIMAVGDQMDDRGWHLDRQHDPDALHLMVSPEHEGVVDDFLADLQQAVEHAGTARGVEARYSQ
jgi:glutamate/tyrosine decarboxylase-like PLP-dependent enzyme